MNDLKTAIQQMTPVSAGADPAKVFTASFVNRLYAAIKALARGEHVSVRGLRKVSDGYGYGLSVIGGQPVRPTPLQSQLTHPDLLYTMGSSVYGSWDYTKAETDPTGDKADEWTASSWAEDAAWTDIYQSWNPPLLSQATITGMSVGMAPNTNVLTITYTGTLGIPTTGGPYEILITTSTDPNLDGKKLYATYNGSGSVKITFSAPYTAVASGGKIHMRAVGVKLKLSRTYRGGYFTDSKFFERFDRRWNNGLFAITEEIESV